MYSQCKPTLAPHCISVFIFAEENTIGIARHLDEIQVTKTDLTPQEKHNPDTEFLNQFFKQYDDLQLFL